MFLIVGDSILWNKYTKELSATELQTTGMGQLAILMHQYIFGILAVWTVVISSYLRKKALRKCKQPFSKSQLQTLNDILIAVFFETVGDFSNY